MAYLNARDGSNATYEAIIDDVPPIYYKEIPDNTTGCQLYYTPSTMKPPGSTPRGWDFKILTEVLLSGVDSYYEGRLFKYTR